MVCAAGDGLAPADRKLYALRDVTGTVESIPLIASSIMSKKIAEGTARAGARREGAARGAFMKTRERPASWPRRWSALGTDARRAAPRALITDMDTPLGRTAGNALEVRESVEVLAGGGPADVGRADPRAGPRDARRRRASTVDPADALADGRAMDDWRG